jgi:hypothetical protein
VLRVVVAEGGPAKRGRTIGRELGDLIARSLTFYRGYFAASSLPFPDVEPYRLAGAALPEESALIDAIAAGAEVDPLELWTVNAVEEAEHVAVERCTSFTALAPEVTLLGHNEQWLAGDAENIALVIEVPPDGPALVSPTVACCLPSVGWNASGIAQGIDSLTAPDDGLGIPRVLVSRHALAARDLDAAVARASVAGRAGGYAHVLAASGGRALTLETSATRTWTIDGPGGHTNHYLAGDGDESSDGSRARFERLSELLHDRPPQTPEDAMEVLRDHASSPQAICEHGAPRDDQASVVLFSMVCELEQGRMWVAPGNPCETPYEEVDLAALAR